MPDIKTILDKSASDFNALVRALSVDTMENRDVKSYKAEYDGERTRRAGSVGMRQPKKLEVYSDTLVDEQGNPVRLEDKTVPVAKIVSNFPKRLVRTDVAMMFGGRMIVSADNVDEGFNEFKRVWARSLGMQDVLMEFAEKVLSETKAAIVFYPVVFEHWSGQKTNEINCRILSIPDDADDIDEFYPHFHNGRMDAFIHKYNEKDDTGRTREKVTIWMRENIIYATKTDSGWDISSEENLFGLIPVVYAETKRPAWDESASMMDAREMRLSRLADTNDYFAEPTIVSYGETNLPGKNTVGKEIQFPIKVDIDSGREYHGDAKVMAWDQSIDSTAKELDEVKSEMHNGVSMPDLGFDNMKGLGNISGVSRRLMFLDSDIKKMINMRIFRPALNRCVTVVSAGIANITNVKYRTQIINNWITVNFESIIPRDEAEEAHILSIANGGKPFNSQRTVVAKSPLTPQGDVEDELKRINNDEIEKLSRENMIGATSFEM